MVRLDANIKGLENISGKCSQKKDIVAILISYKSMLSSKKA